MPAATFALLTMPLALLAATLFDLLGPASVLVQHSKGLLNTPDLLCLCRAAGRHISSAWSSGVFSQNGSAINWLHLLRWLDFMITIPPSYDVMHDFSALRSSPVVTWYRNAILLTLQADPSIMEKFETGGVALDPIIRYCSLVT